MEKRLHVLLVDDEPDFRFSAAVALKRAGYRVSEAGDGGEALSMILDAEDRGVPFSLLLTDVRMPGISGVDLLDELNRRGIRLPAIAITGFGEPGMYAELAVRGCLDAIEKPFEPRELVDRIEALRIGATREAL